MNKYFLLIALFAVTGCSRKTTVEVSQKPLTNAEILKTAKVDKYKIASPYGHEFTVEVTRFSGNEQSYNNTCKVTYILTNTGNKDFNHREIYSNNSTSKVVKEGDPSIIFEFATADGKRIQKTQFLYDDIAVGRSSEVHNVSIDVGLRSCDGEVKPIEIQYKQQ